MNDCDESGEMNKMNKRKREREKETSCVLLFDQLLFVVVMVMLQHDVLWWCGVMVFLLF